MISLSIWLLVVSVVTVMVIPLVMTTIMTLRTLGVIMKKAQLWRSKRLSN